MPYRQGTFREKFTTHELSKLEFRKLNGYYFAKKNRQDPEWSWMLIKDDTSAVIKYLCYVHATKEQLLEFMGGKTRMKLMIFEQVFKPQLYSKCDSIHTMEDLEAAVIDLHYTLGADELKQSFDKSNKVAQIISIKKTEEPTKPLTIIKQGRELKTIDLSQIGKK